ncbi:MAG: GNAT family N-acetyltransferase [Anaerolineales bacterium]|jgi:RimJ/RimL family protein N-acetyltransferase
MDFYPPGRDIPEHLEASDFVLRPLQVGHLHLDYDAVMEEPAYLRSWSQSGWPSDDFTLAENRLDLEHHELEHRKGTAFTYTVLSKEGDHCLGCVYITPIGERIAYEKVLQATETKLPDYTADVCFWVRPSLHNKAVDRRLLSALSDWFTDEWAFERIYIHTSAEDRRQQKIFKQAELQYVSNFKARDPRPGHWFLYLFFK